MIGIGLPQITFIASRGTPISVVVARAGPIRSVQAVFVLFVLFKS